MEQNLTLIQTIIAGSAIVIAILAFILTWYEGRAIRRHLRLSVRPNLRIDSHVSSGRLEKKLLNAGLGPAIIKNAKLNIDGNFIVNLTQADLETTRNLIIEAIRSNNLDYVAACSMPRNTVINVNQETELLKITFIGSPDFQYCHNLSLRIEYDIVYTSFYGEKFGY